MAGKTTYRASFKPIAKKMCELGATIPEVAAALGCAPSTVSLWMSQNKSFSEAMRVGREAADERVKSSLFQRAVGYTRNSEKIMQYMGEPVVIPFVEEIAPDVNACQVWLRNRTKEFKGDGSADVPTRLEPLRITRATGKE